MLAEAADQRLKGDGVGVGLPIFDLSYKHRTCGFHEYEVCLEKVQPSLIS